MPKILANYDLKKNQLLNVRIENLTTAPSNPVEGLIYYNTQDYSFYIYQNSAWVNHTTLTASRISDFATAVKAIKLNEMATPTADVSMGGNKITNLGLPTEDTDAASKAYVDGVAQGLAVHNPVRVATTAELTTVYDNGTSGVGATLTNNGTQAAISIDGVALSVNDRVLVKDQSTFAHNGIYVVSVIGDASTNWVLTRADDFDNSPTSEIHDGDFFFVQEGSVNVHNGYVQTEPNAVTVGTSDVKFLQFSGAGQITAGEGLSKTGNEMSVNVDDSTIEINGSDNLQIKDSGVTNAKIASGVDAVKIADGSVSNTEFQYLNGVTSGIQGQIDAEVSARTTAVSNEATARSNADTTLQGNIDAVAADLAQELLDRADANTAIQTEVDAIETGAGLGTDGSYTANGSANYIATATSLKDADNKLDTALKAEETARIAADSAESTARTNADTAIQSELDATQSGAGLGTDGAYSANLGANYISTATSLKDADNKLDTALKAEETARTSADGAIQSELDATQTGAGLGTNGSYSANGSANYISTATSLKDADNKLDAALKAGLDTAASDLSSAVSDLNTDIAAVQTELDDTQIGAGLDADGGYTPFNSSNYIDAAVSLKNADFILDGQVKTVADGLATEITNRTNAITSVQDAIDAEEAARIAADDAIEARLDGLETGGGVEVSDTHSRESNYDNSLFQGTYASLEARLIDIETVIDAKATTLSTEITNRTNADSGIQSELDSVETSVGLNANGTKPDFTSTNFILAGDNVIPSINKLDTALKSEESARISADNTLQSTISTETTNRTNADTAIQTELDAVETSVGLNANGTKPDFTSTNYILAADNVIPAINKLDTALKSEESARISAISDLETALADEETRALAAEAALDTRVDALEAKVTKYAINVGDGVATSIDVVHNLNTKDVIVMLYDVATGDMVITDVNVATVNKVVVSFTVAPTTEEYRVVVISA